MEKKEGDFLNIQELKKREKCPDGVFLVIKEYPYRLNLSLDDNFKETTEGYVDTIESSQPGKKWIKRANGKIELISENKESMELKEKAWELLQKNKYLIFMFNEYFKRNLYSWEKISVWVVGELQKQGVLDMVIEKVNQEAE